MLIETFSSIFNHSEQVPTINKLSFVVTMTTFGCKRSNKALVHVRVPQQRVEIAVVDHIEAVITKRVLETSRVYAFVWKRELGLLFQSWFKSKRRQTQKCCTLIRWWPTMSPCSVICLSTLVILMYPSIGNSLHLIEMFLDLTLGGVLFFKIADNWKVA